MQIQSPEQSINVKTKGLTFSPKQPLPLSPSINADDYIGTESCVNDLIRSGEAEESRSSTSMSIRKQTKVTREFPPPIPMLARTENLHSHMPWILKRYYTPDGRLILKEEKVRHHEYFRAHRANGRLTLQLVPLDDDVLLDDTIPPFNAQNDHHEVQEEICEPHESKEHSTVFNDGATCADEDDKKVIVGVNEGANGWNCSVQYALLGCPSHHIRTVHG